MQATPGTGANGVSSGPFTTVVNGDLLYGVTVNTGVGDDVGAPPLVAGTTSAAMALTGSTSGISGNTCAMIKSEWGVQTTAGASTVATFTQNSAAARITFLIALKAAAGAADTFGNNMVRLMM